MSDPRIVASARGRGSASPFDEDEAQTWRVLGWIGLAFLTVGGADFVLTWIPLNFGNREWEFGTVTQSFNGLPILLLGVGMIVAASERSERRWWGTLGMGVAALLTLWIVGGFAIWAMTVPLAMATVPEELLPGIQKSAVKTLIQSLVYPAVLIYVLRRSWRAHRQKAAEARPGK